MEDRRVFLSSMMTWTIVKPSDVLKVRIKFPVAVVMSRKWLSNKKKKDYLVDFSSSMNYCYGWWNLINLSHRRCGWWDTVLNSSTYWIMTGLMKSMHHHMIKPIKTIDWLLLIRLPLPICQLGRRIPKAQKVVERYRDKAHGVEKRLRNWCQKRYALLHRYCNSHW